MARETSSDADATVVRKVVVVQVPPPKAWRAFTEHMGRWWPLTTHKIGKAKAVDAVVEPRVGGRWYERGDDGSSCDWGRVLSWEPPSRLVLSWDISADWRHDAALKTEVEIRFIAEGKAATRVVLEHRHLDRYGARSAEMRSTFDGDRGWAGLLASFARVASEEAEQTA